MKKIAYGAAIALVAVALPNLALAAPAGVCADFSNDIYYDSGFYSGSATVYLPFTVKAGDHLSVGIEYFRDDTADDYEDPSALTLTLPGGSVTHGPVSLDVEGGHSFMVILDYTVPSSATGESFPKLDLHITATETGEQYGYIVGAMCQQAAIDPSPTRELDKLRDRAGRLVMRSGERINRLVDGSIDAAFGASGQNNVTLGYAGNVVVDLTPEELVDAGVTLWGAVAYEAAIPGTSNWLGADVTGVGGMNYRVNDDLVLGLFGSVGVGAHADGNDTIATRGLGIGGVAALRLDDAWRAQLIASAQKWRYDLDSNGTTASYDGLLLAVDGSVQGVLPLSAQVDFVPEVGLQVRQERQDAFVDSANVAYAERVRLGFDGTAGGGFRFYPLGGSDLVFTAGGTGSYGSLGLRGAVEAGLIINVAPGVRFDIDGAVRNIGSANGTTAAITGKVAGAF